MILKEKIYRAAYNEALDAKHDKTRVCAVVFRGGRILGTGHNFQHKTHPKSTHPFGRIHAELAAIIDAIRTDPVDYTFRGTSLYVHRLKKDGSSGLAKPCCWCQELIARMGIENVYWSEG